MADKYYTFEDVKIIAYIEVRARSFERQFDTLYYNHNIHNQMSKQNQYRCEYWEYTDFEDWN